MKTITFDCPDQLHRQLEALIRAGWIKTHEEGVVEALRRFLDSHQPQLLEGQILADVEWGLHGRD